MNDVQAWESAMVEAKFSPKRVRRLTSLLANACRGRGNGKKIKRDINRQMRQAFNSEFESRWRKQVALQADQVERIGDEDFLRALAGEEIEPTVANNRQYELRQNINWRKEGF